MTSAMRFFALALISILGTLAHNAPSPIVITGATGRTGSQVYISLKKQGFPVRALVRNTSKAREYLGCDQCTEAEGIYVGDVTQPASLEAVMAGAGSLVITTGPAYHCTFPKIYVGCKYYDGADPKTMSWEAVKNQVAVFANSTKGATPRHVILTSNDLTTTPDNFLDKIDHGFGCFYALNGEAFTMTAGWSPMDLNYEFIARADVARLLTFAAANPDATSGLRFDVTSKKNGVTPTADVSTVFKAAMFPWDPRKSA